jgi:hypothetical protein
MIAVEQLADAVVRAFVAAVNAGDRDAFCALLAPGATMSDDGSERNLEEWVDREIFSSNGRMAVESESDRGRSVVVTYTKLDVGRDAHRLEVRRRGRQGQPLRDGAGLSRRTVASMLRSS